MVDESWGIPFNWDNGSILSVIHWVERMLQASRPHRAAFYLPLAPALAQKIFPLCFKITMPTAPEQPDFAHAKSFVLCSFQPIKSACSAAAEKWNPN